MMLDARRPSFAHDFPRTPELDALVEDFARGHYARIRAEAPRLARATVDEDVRRAAQELVEHTAPDRLAVGFLALAAVLLITLTTFWVVNGRAPAPSTPPSSAEPR